MGSLRELVAWRGGACALAAVVSFATCGSVVWQHTHVGRAPSAEPAATAAFMSAFAEGDEEAAERTASPLYGAEWARRGLSASDRAALEPHPPRAEGGGSPWITFTYLGGAADGRGFLHALYAAYAACDEVCHGPEIWRVDAEPSGRVIWTEMVWLFGDDVASIVATDRESDVPWSELSQDLLDAHPRVVLAVRAATGPEGYYELGIPSREGAVVFFATGPDGDMRPGAWTYGAPRASIDAFGAPHSLAPLRLPPDQEALRHAYLESLP